MNRDVVPALRHTRPAAAGVGFAQGVRICADLIARAAFVIAVMASGLLVAGNADAIPPSLPGLPGITAVNQQPVVAPGAGAPLAPNASTTAHPCARPAAGSVIPQPTQVYSANGALNVHLDYYPDVDINGNPTFCFLYTDNNGVISQGPTLHGKPGDQFNVSVTNHVAPLPGDAGTPADNLIPVPGFTPATGQCGDPQQFAMDPSSVNVHFHGFLVTPQCQGDNVARTIINAGETFQYSFAIPANEPPGLYWFHPHVHGAGEQSVQGGASGSLIIDGIEQFQPSVAGLPARVLVLRDAVLSNTDLSPAQGTPVPSWDVSINYVPVTYLATQANPTPSKPYDDAGQIQMQAGQKELWRVANASADSILDFQVIYTDKTGDHIQTLSVVGLDGVPIGSQDGTRKGHAVPMTTISMAPAQRAEFVIDPPGPGVTSARIQTLNVNTGLIGDTDPVRVIANITTGLAPTGLPILPAYAGKTWPQRFEGVDAPAITAKRKLYFYEEVSNPLDPNSLTNFYIALQGSFNEPYLAWGESTPYPYPAEKILYTPGAPPVITTKVGAVEEWTVENRALEAHVFHIHQIHYKLQAINGVPLAAGDRYFRDDYTIPGWNPPLLTLADGSQVPGDPVTGTHFSAMKPAQVKAFLALYPYPSITAKFDFRDPIAAGTFVFHCHILAHEDYGMMASMVVVK